LASDQFKPQTPNLSIKRLTELNQALMSFPLSIHINHKLERPIQRRKAAFNEPDRLGIDWGAAEELAFATILVEGIPIRLTGQDVERGTFSQRHAAFHDVETGERYIPLQGLQQAAATFDLHNSPLSENAAIGFEFGYSIMAPHQLVIWEAQYGDFINSAQPVIDEFVTSALAKWEQRPSLVLLLPHGYEGQGPDHSSGRPERFLQTATPNSLRVANCTTSAQYFHLLRLQASTLDSAPLPLVIFTPKSLLRHPLVASSAKMLATGRWNPVLDDSQVAEPSNIQRLLFCTGKIAIDLASHEERSKHPETAIIRIEQLLPFPETEVCDIFNRYNHITDVAWIQEEPENMGWWSYIQPHLMQIIQGRWQLGYIGRAISSSPAEGSFTWHSMNQSALIDQAFLAEARPEREGVIVYKG
jgi:2-oxoglutarate dehydrogenase E1 component